MVQFLLSHPPIIVPVPGPSVVSTAYTSPPPGTPAVPSDWSGGSTFPRTKVPPHRRRRTDDKTHILQYPWTISHKHSVGKSQIQRAATIPPPDPLVANVGRNSVAVGGWKILQFSRLFPIFLAWIDIIEIWMCVEHFQHDGCDGRWSWVSSLESVF